MSRGLNHLRDTQAKAWPSARDVALVGKDYYGDRGRGDSEDG